MRPLAAALLIVAAFCATWPGVWQARAEPAHARRARLLVYESRVTGEARFLALAEDAAGIWRTTCDRLTGIEQPQHGELIEAELELHREGAPPSEQSTTCALEVHKRIAASEHGLTVFAPPSLGAFTGWMSRAEVAGVLGQADVPSETTVGTHLQSGPYELHMANGALTFIVLRLAELKTRLVVPDQPTLEVSDSFERRGKLQELQRPEVFQPTLPKAQATQFAKVRFASRGFGGFADLNPVADQVLLFAHLPLREPQQKAHLRATLIGLYQRGLHAEPVTAEALRVQEECTQLEKGEPSLSLLRPPNGRWRTTGWFEFAEHASLWRAGAQVRVAHLSTESADNAITVRYCFRRDGTLALVRTSLFTLYAELGPVSVERLLYFDLTGRKLLTREQVYDAEQKPVKTDFGRFALDAYERPFAHTDKLKRFFGNALLDAPTAP